jgi:chitinase
LKNQKKKKRELNFSFLENNMKRLLLSSGLFLCYFLLALETSVSLSYGESKSLLDYGDEEPAKSYKVVCYYTNWAQYRMKPATFLPENINASLCTHLLFAFAKISEQSELASFEWNDESTDWSKGMYEKVVMLKRDNKDLKVLVAVGGWNHGSLLFSNMARDDTLRANFVRTTVAFLKKHKFDGLDLDWEYPANRDTEDRPDDKVHFTALCKELHAAFKPHKMILTAAVAAGLKYMKTGYEMAQIHKYLDIINIMAYDLHGGWDNVTGSNAPLYGHQFDSDKTLNVDYALRYWLKYVPAEKLVLGVSSYGRSFKLKEGYEACPLTDTPVKGVGTAGRFTREDGSLAYYEICEKILVNKWKYVWNDEQKVPYIYSQEVSSSSASPMEWAGFEDVRSAEVKAKYIMEKKLGGAMIWSLDFDDFEDKFCGQGAFPLLRVLNHYLRPELSVVMPDASVLWRGGGVEEAHSSQMSILNTKSKRPIYESDLMLNQKDLNIADSLSSHNIFGLIQNDVLQVYKFCQCKNGTHLINSNSNPNPKKSDADSYIVDCNIKKVYHASNPPPVSGNTDHETDLILKPPQENDENNETTKGNGKNAKKPSEHETVDDLDSIWSIFGLKPPKSSASISVEKQTICMIFSQLIIFLALPFLQ